MPIRRTIDEMIQAARFQLQLLSEYKQKLGNEKRLEYLGEVANKIRLLAAEIGRNNVPLLIELSVQTGIELRWKPGGPRLYIAPGVLEPDSYSLAEYMQCTAFGLRLTSGKYVEFTKSELVRAIAEKLGGAHHDWTLPEKLVEATQIPVFLGNSQILTAELIGTANTVLWFGVSFLKEFDIRQSKGRSDSHPGMA